MQLEKAKIFVLLVFAVDYIQTELSPDGQNVCLKTETYEKKIEVKIRKPKRIKKKKWCWNISSRFSCEQSITKWEFVTEQRTVNTTKVVAKCCDGYREEETKCLPVCLKGCANGKCVAPELCSCSPGFYGPECEKECSDGLWGENCVSSCNCSNHGTCNKANGTCNCEKGWTGDRCESPCQRGSYGLMCKMDCKCNNSSCHHITGECHTTSKIYKDTEMSPEAHQTEDSYQVPSEANESKESDQVSFEPYQSKESDQVFPEAHQTEDSYQVPSEANESKESHRVSLEPFQSNESDQVPSEANESKESDQVSFEPYQSKESDQVFPEAHQTEDSYQVPSEANQSRESDQVSLEPYQSKESDQLPSEANLSKETHRVSLEPYQSNESDQVPSEANLSKESDQVFPEGHQTEDSYQVPSEANQSRESDRVSLEPYQSKESDQVPSEANLSKESDQVSLEPYQSKESDQVFPEAHQTEDSYHVSFPVPLHSAETEKTFSESPLVEIPKMTDKEDTIGDKKSNWVKNVYASFEAINTESVTKEINYPKNSEEMAYTDMTEKILSMDKAKEMSAKTDMPLGHSGVSETSLDKFSKSEETEMTDNVKESLAAILNNSEGNKPEISLSGSEQDVDKTETDNFINGKKGNSIKNTMFKIFHFLPGLSVFSGVSFLTFIIAAMWLINKHRSKAKKFLISAGKKEKILHVEDPIKYPPENFFWRSNCTSNPVYLTDVDLNRTTPVLETFKPLNCDKDGKTSEKQSR